MQQHLFDKQVYQQRRYELKKKVGNGLIILPGNKEAGINFRDNWYPFRQDSSFLYYFGIAEANLAGVIDIDADEEYIIGNELTIDDIVWTGPLATVREMAASVGIDKTKPMADLATLLKGRKPHYLPPYRSDQTLQLSALLGTDNDTVNAGFSVELIKAIVAQRSIKSVEEIMELHKACDITSAMHLEVMRSVRPGMKEYELVGIAKKVVADHHTHLSFPPILTKQGEVLHNHYHGNELHDGDLLLFDGGAESHSFYAGDMTRTYPVGKSFTSEQRDLYQVMYNAHRTAIEALAPGKRYRDIHLLASKTLVEGLTGLGIMKGDPDEAVAAGAHTMFFQCGLGHMMGLDVHDMENLGEQYVGYTDELQQSKEFGLKSLRLGRKLEPGFVITVEPGIYIIPSLIDQNQSQGKYLDFINYDKLAHFRNFGGMRVEDDFAITDSGYQLLGTPLANSVEAIEDIRKSAY